MVAVKILLFDELLRSVGKRDRTILATVYGRLSAEERSALERALIRLAKREIHGGLGDK